VGTWLYVSEVRGASTKEGELAREEVMTQNEKR
jgi:hypothetical protein